MPPVPAARNPAARNRAPRSRTVRTVAALSTSSITLLLALSAGGPALASPPGGGAVPVTAAAAPRLVFHEGFERGMGTTPVSLVDYVGPRGETYTADPAWLDVTQCNGIVISHDSRAAEGCRAGDNLLLRGLAQALGEVEGADDPASNHVVSASTANRAVPAGAVQLASVEATSLGVGGRFVSFGVDAAARACRGHAHPLLDFSLVDGDVEHPVSTHPIDPCTDPASADHRVDGDDIRAGSFVSDGAFLVGGDSFRVVLRNAQSSADGNDGAIDNLRVFDSTPSVEPRFAGSSPVVGDVARLVLTVHNTSEGGAKHGWSFTESLPEGLVVAADPHARTSCDAGHVGAEAGTGSVRVDGDLAIGITSCTVSFDVGSSLPGRYVVDSTSVTDRLGVDATGAQAAVVFAAEVDDLTMDVRSALTTDVDGDGTAGPGDDIVFEHTVVNRGNATLTDLTVESTDGPMSCETTVLASGASSSCRSAPRPVRQADVDAGGIRHEAVAEATSRTGAVVSARAALFVPILGVATPIEPVSPVEAGQADASSTVAEPAGADRAPSVLAFTGLDARLALVSAVMVVLAGSAVGAVRFGVRRSADRCDRAAVPDPQEARAG